MRNAKCNGATSWKPPKQNLPQKSHKGAHIARSVEITLKKKIPAQELYGKEFWNLESVLISQWQAVAWGSRFPPDSLGSQSWGGRSHWGRDCSPLGSPGSQLPWPCWVGGWDIERGRAATAQDRRRPPTRPPRKRDSLANLTPSVLFQRMEIREDARQKYKDMTDEWCLTVKPKRGGSIGESCWLVEAGGSAAGEWSWGGEVEATQRRGGSAAGHQLLTDPFTKLLYPFHV